MTCVGSRPSATQPSASQTRPRRSSTGVVCVGQRRFARLAEKDHAEELDHHVGGKRRGQRDDRGAEWQQHVDEWPRHLVCEEERLQQQPLGDEAVEGRQTRHRQRADQREPGDPGHAMDQAAEPAEIALAGRMQHRAGAEEQQALHERVIEAVIERGDQRERSERMHADAAKTMASPMPVKMMPMFSIDEHASSRFMSVCTAANTTP